MLAAGEAARIFTGAPIPQGADAIAIQEDCRRSGETVVVPGPLVPGTFVRPRGNDIRAGAMVLGAGTRIRPQEMGVAASVGIDRIDVRRRPRVAIVSSGDELRRPGEPLGPGQIYNSNRFTLLGLLQRLGWDAVDLGLVADTFEATRDALLEGAGRADVLITTGGVSVGEEDHVRRALEAIGELEMWKVRVKPGKPIVYGTHRGVRSARPAREPGFRPGHVLPVRAAVRPAPARCHRRLPGTGERRGPLRMASARGAPGVCAGAAGDGRRRRDGGRDSRQTGLRRAVRYRLGHRARGDRRRGRRFRPAIAFPTTRSEICSTDGDYPYPGRAVSTPALSSRRRIGRNPKVGAVCHVRRARA